MKPAIMGVFLALLLSFNNGQTLAADWQLVEPLKGVNIYLDAASIERGPIIKAWEKWQYFEPQKDLIGSYISTFVYAGFNCQSRQVAIYSVIRYGADGNVAASTENLESKPGVLVPDSLQEKYFNHVCSVYKSASIPAER